MKSEIEKQQHQNERVFNFVARRYDRGIIGKWLLSIVKATIDEISLKKNSRILDAGVGTGNLLVLLERTHKNLDLYGVDISEKMLAIARKKIRTAKIMKLSVKNIDKKFKDNFFNYIFVVDAFHHFPDHREVLAAFNHVLKKKGKLIITDFDFGSLFNYIFHMLEPGNSWIYTQKAMRNLFIESGFSVEKQKRIGLFSVVTIGIKSTHTTQ